MHMSARKENSQKGKKIPGPRKYFSIATWGEIKSLVGPISKINGGTIGSKNTQNFWFWKENLFGIRPWMASLNLF